MNKGIKQVVLQTFSLIVGFMAWVLISSLMPFISEDLNITPTQAVWIITLPVILGSILRVPAGVWTDRFGARKVFTAIFLFLLLPVILVGNAGSVLMLLIGGFFLGIGGAVFSIGVTSLPNYFPRQKQGLVNGIYGLGNIGTAITAFIAPLLAVEIGWRNTVKGFLILLIFFAIMNFLYGDRQHKQVETSLRKQFNEVYTSKKLWLLCLFYFITFGSFIAFTIYLPIFLVKNFSLTLTDAGFRTAGFIALATLFRPIGGWLADKINPFYVMAGVFSGLTFAGFLLSITPSLPIFSFGCLLVAISSGTGNGAIFKLVPLYFSKQAGVVNGLVSAAGGIGGFFPPLILTAMFNLTQHYAIGFMALSEFSLAALILVIWAFYNEKLSVSDKIIDSIGEGITVTDINGIIQDINPAFTKITGYTLDEVVGKTPSVLQSGEHDIEFYRKMWADLRIKGEWHGLIWNKRKNGDVYQETLSIRALKNDAGEVKNYVGIFREIQ